MPRIQTNSESHPLHRSTRSRAFRQAHRNVPAGPVRQAHPRLPARLRQWHSPLALAFVAGVTLLSLLPLPTAFGAAPLERPRSPLGTGRDEGAAGQDAPGFAVAGATRERDAGVSSVSAGFVAAGDARPARDTPAADALRPSEPTPDQQSGAAEGHGHGIASPAARSSVVPRPASSADSRSASARDAGSVAAHIASRGARSSATGGVAPRPPALLRSLAGTRAVAGFLGDSYTTGWAGAGIGAAGWPALVSTALGLGATKAAVAGSGFVNPGWTGQPIATRVASIVRAHPRIVFIAAGHNDRRFGASAASRAADAVLVRLRSALPTSIVVVVGPIWQDGRPPASLVALRDHLRATSARLGAVFIDPLAGGWFAGAAHDLIGSDGIHPTAAGHRRIAALVLGALRARGIVAASLRGR